jgi:hypothetical protein
MNEIWDKAMGCLAVVGTACSFINLGAICVTGSSNAVLNTVAILSACMVMGSVAGGQIHNWLNPTNE